LFYVAMFAVGGAFGLLMVVMGPFTFADAKAMAVYGQPPQRWIEGVR
jgi:hypothetical protein